MKNDTAVQMAGADVLALTQLALEAKHYLDTGKGAQFLQAAIDKANAALTATLSAKADALHAAAPAMLEALKGMVREFPTPRGDVRKNFSKLVYLEAARAAVRSAEGTTPTVAGA